MNKYNNWHVLRHCDHPNMHFLLLPSHPCKEKVIITLTLQIGKLGADVNCPRSKEQERASGGWAQAIWLERLGSSPLSDIPKVAIRFGLGNIKANKGNEGTFYGSTGKTLLRVAMPRGAGIPELSLPRCTACPLWRGARCSFPVKYRRRRENSQMRLSCGFLSCFPVISSVYLWLDSSKDLEFHPGSCLWQQRCSEPLQAWGC